MRSRCLADDHDAVRPTKNNGSIPRFVARALAGSAVSLRDYGRLDPVMGRHIQPMAYATQARQQHVQQVFL